MDMEHGDESQGVLEPPTGEARIEHKSKKSENSNENNQLELIQRGN